MAELNPDLPTPAPESSQTPKTPPIVLPKTKISSTIANLIGKLIIFTFGIFCGIGIVYKSGVKPPEPAPSNVASYQKRIEELQNENASLRKQLEGGVVRPTAPKAVDPPVLPPVLPPVVPPTKTGEPKSGFVVPIK